MKGCLLLALLFAATLPMGAAEHDVGCVLTSADPATYLTLDLAPIGRGVYYLEERSVPAALTPDTPVPGSGFLVGRGTWLYQEFNEIEGLQRGGFGEFECIGAAVGQQCLIGFDESIYDELCGHGFDLNIFGVYHL